MRLFLLLCVLFTSFACTKIDQNDSPSGQKISITYELVIDSAEVQPYDYLKPPTDGFNFVRSFEVDSFWSEDLNHYYNTKFRRAGFRLKVYNDTVAFSARIIADGISILDTSGIIVDSIPRPPQFTEPYYYIMKEW